MITMNPADRHTSLIAAQKRELEALRAFDRFCIKHNIHYSLAFGNLLGAVRHNGFIPWDDDVDVMMEEPDYHRFVSLFHRYETGYTLRGSYRTSFSVIDNITRLENKSESTCIDIFVVERISKNRLSQFIQSLFAYLVTFVQVLPNPKWDTANTYDRTMRFAQFLSPGYNRLFSRFDAKSAIDGFAQRLFPSARSGDYLVKAGYPHILRGFIVIREQDFRPLKRTPYENMDAPIIQNPEGFLRQKFGNYWVLPPEHERVPIHIRDRGND